MEARKVNRRTDTPARGFAFRRSAARLRPFVVAAVLLAALSREAAAQEWSQWRGPNRDAAAAERFDQLARYRVADGAVWAYPAPAGPHLVVRDGATLSLWAVR